MRCYLTSCLGTPAAGVDWLDSAKIEQQLAVPYKKKRKKWVEREERTRK